jgi:hypothetical protein
MNKLFLLGFFLISSCSHGPINVSLPFSEKEENQRNLLLGKWKGSAETKKDGIYEWLIHRNKDGTYKLWSKLHGNVFIEEGVWGSSGDIYFRSAKWLKENNKKTAMEATAVSDAAAEIIYLDEKKFSFKYLESGEVLTVYKVSDETSF